MNYSLNWGEASAVVVSATGMYLGVLLVLRLAGRRLAAALSSYDVAIGVGLGALMGRTILGQTPNLPAGLLGLVTLLALHAGTHALRRSLGGGRGPLLLVRDGEVLPDAVRRARLGEEDLRCALRRASLGSYAEVGAMVMERTGAISVLRRGQPADDALADVAGAASNVSETEGYNPQSR